MEVDRLIPRRSQVSTCKSWSVSGGTLRAEKKTSKSSCDRALPGMNGVGPGEEILRVSVSISIIFLLTLANPDLDADLPRLKAIATI